MKHFLEIPKALMFCVLALILSLSSFPMMMIGMGCGIAGNKESEDWWIDNSPINRFLEWRDK